MRTAHSIAALISVVFAWAAGAQAVMIPLGDLPGGNFRSVPLSLSGNGQVAVGISDSATGLGGSEAFRWTLESGMTALGRPSGGTSDAFGVSPGGEYTVGTSTIPGSILGTVWKADGSVYTVADIPGGNTVSGVVDVSDTGVAVGSSQYGTGPFGPVSQAIRWTADGGLVPMGFLNDTDIHSEAYAISTDGSVIAGRGTSGNWRWTEQTGMVATAGIEFESRGMTEDGSFLLGRQRITVNGGPQLHAVIWSEVTGTTELDRSGFRAGTQISGAIDATPGAEIIVGLIGSVTFSATPYIWFDQGAFGMSLADYLLENGLDFAATGYRMENIAGISDDGTRFLLETFNPDGIREALLIVVPAPGGALLAGLGAGVVIASRRRN